MTGLAVRNAAPLLLEAGKNFLRNLGKRGLNASIGLASDAVRGKNMRQAIKNRVGEVLDQSLAESSNKRPTKRKKVQSKRSKKASKKSRKSTSHKDIFS